MCREEEYGDSKTRVGASFAIDKTDLRQAKCWCA